MPHPLTNSLLHGSIEEVLVALREIANTDTNTPNPGTKIRALLKFLDSLTQPKSQQEFQQQKQSLEIDGLKALVDAVTLCDDDMLVSAHPHLMAQYIPRLHLKTYVPLLGDQLKSLLLLEKPGSFYALREFGLKNKDPSVRFASIQELTLWIDLNQGNTAFQKLTSTMVRLLKDGISKVRVASYNLLVNFYSQVPEEVQRHLLRNLEREEISGPLINKINLAITKLQSEQRPHSSNLTPTNNSKEANMMKPARPVTLPQAAPVARNGVEVFNSDDSSSLRKAESPVPCATSRPASEPGSNTNIQKVQLELEGDSNFAFQKLYPLKISSKNEFLAIAKKAAASYEGKESEHNWSSRLQETKSYRSSLRSAPWDPETIRAAFKLLQRGLSEVILSLRTTLVTEVSLAIKDTAQLVGKQSFFHELFDPVIESLIKVACGPKKLTACTAQLSFCILLVESPSISNRQFNAMINESKSLKVNARAQSYYWLKVMLASGHQPSLLSRQTHIEGILLRSINDAAPVGREHGRDLYRILQEVWPDVIHKISSKLTQGNLKALSQTSDSLSKRQVKTQASVQFQVPRQQTQHQVQSRMGAQPSLQNFSASLSSPRSPIKLASRPQTPVLTLAKPISLKLAEPRSPRVLTESLRSPMQPRATSSPVKVHSLQNDVLSHSMANLSVDDANMSIEIDTPECDFYSDAMGNVERFSSPESTGIPELPQDKNSVADIERGGSEEVAPERISSAPLSSEEIYDKSKSETGYSEPKGDDQEILGSEDSITSPKSANIETANIEPNDINSISRQRKIDDAEKKPEHFYAEKVTSPPRQLSPSETSYHTPSSSPYEKTNSDISMSSASVTSDSLESPDTEKVPLLTTLSSDNAEFIESFPTKSSSTKARIKEMVAAVQQLTAETSTLAALAVLVKAASSQQYRHGPLEGAVKVWQNCYSIDMNLREYILPFLSHPELAVETVISALVLLRCLLLIETSNSGAYLDTISCLRHLQAVAQKFQQESLEVGNLLHEIYDLIIPRGLESCRSVTDLLLNQENLIYSLQVVTKFVKYHLDFANEAASDLRSLVAKAASDPDVRTRQHVYPLLLVVHYQNPQVFDVVVSAMSAGQRKFVDYYLEVKALAP